MLLSRYARFYLIWAFLIMFYPLYVCPSVCKLFIFWRTTGPNSTKHSTKHPCVKGNQVCSNEKPSPFPNHSFKQMYLLISTNQVSDVAHGSLVCFIFQVVKPFDWLTRSQGLMLNFRNIQGQILTKRYSASQELLIKFSMPFKWSMRK